MRVFANALLFCTAAGLLCLSGSSGYAEQFTVPDDPGCGSIQSCIAQAGTGDVITVQPGTYPENVDFLGLAVTVRSQDGPEATVIDGGGTDAVLTFASGEGAGSVIEGFTITNAGPLGGSASGPRYGVNCVGASPVIRGNIITHALSEENGRLEGIHVDGGAPLIDGNRLNNVVNAYASGAGYGIWIAQDAGDPAAVISANEIIYNGAGCQHPMGLCVGAGIHFAGESVEIRNNLLKSNGGSGGYGIGHGVSATGNQVVFVHNTVVDSYGNGAMIEADVEATVLNNILAYNASALVFKTALCVTGDGDLTTDYNNFWENGDDYCMDPGAHDLHADPLLVDPLDITAPDLHLQEGSPCLDRGTDAGVSEDVDGDPRPQGFGFDMGADELPETPWGPAATAAFPPNHPANTASGPINTLFAAILPAVFAVRLRRVLSAGCAGLPSPRFRVRR